MQHPTLLPALIVGIGTVAAPYFVMQPAMGLRPSAAARLHSLITHAMFGLGLYLAGRVVSSLLTGTLGAPGGCPAHGVTEATAGVRSNGMMVLRMSISGPSSYTFV